MAASLLVVRLRLAATLFIYLKLGSGEEICPNEIVNVSCSADESLFIESAIIGRLNGSRCYNRTDSEQECRSDIRDSVQRRSRETKGRLRIPSVDDFFMSKAPRRCLLQASEYSLEIKHRCLKRERHEVCLAEEFRVECEESIEIQSAVVGRMRNSRCIDFDDRNLSCAQDVQRFFKSICDKRKNCSILITPGMFDNSSCDRRLEQYLEVSHTCLTSTGQSENNSSSKHWLKFLFVVLAAVSVALSVAVVRLSYKCKRDATEKVESRNRRGEQHQCREEYYGDQRLRPLGLFVVCSNDLYDAEEDDQHRTAAAGLHSRNLYDVCQMVRDEKEEEEEEDAYYSDCKFPLEEQYSVLKNTEHYS